MQPTQHTTLLIIGGGPGGYVAAIRAGQLGIPTVLIEGQSLGGTCLNVGCIPSKALLHTSHLFEEACHGFAAQGITVGTPKIDVPTMIERKNTIVKQLTTGIKGLFKKNKVTLLNGHGSFVAQSDGGWQVKVGEELVEAKQVIVATGSRPRHLAGVAVDNVLVCDNVGALDINAVPKKLAIIGAGVIGLEMGSVWRRLGAEVTILEALPDFLSVADVDVAKEAARVFRKQGLNIQLGVTIGEVKAGKKSVSIAYTDKDGQAQKLDADRLIVSVGRVPNTEGLNAEAVGLKHDERGRIDVDDHCRTNLPGVWAVGDVVSGPMLAHKAMEEAVMVAERERLHLLDHRLQVVLHLFWRCDAGEQKHVIVFWIFQFFSSENTLQCIVVDAGEVEFLEWIEIHSLGEYTKLHWFQILWTFGDNHDVGTALSAQWFAQSSCW